jgi:hypothetical protein
MLLFSRGDLISIFIVLVEEKIKCQAHLIPQKYYKNNTYLKLTKVSFFNYRIENNFKTFLEKDFND